VNIVYMYKIRQTRPAGRQQTPCQRWPADLRGVRLVPKRSFVPVREQAYYHIYQEEREESYAEVSDVGVDNESGHARTSSDRSGKRIEPL
jgi:hypothetical protein